MEIVVVVVVEECLFSASNIVSPTLTTTTTIIIQDPLLSQLVLSGFRKAGYAWTIWPANSATMTKLLLRAYVWILCVIGCPPHFQVSKYLLYLLAYLPLFESMDPWSYQGSSRS
jgi:hypothetical protein